MMDREHLARIRRFVDEVDPILVSGHLAWSTHRGTYLNDLLPLPYDDETLHVVAAHVREVQDALDRASNGFANLTRNAFPRLVRSCVG